MAEDPAQAATQPIERPLNLIPVILKEAALDSPSWRANTYHFAEQIELIEKWLEGYLKASTKLVSEISSLETVVNNFLAQSAPPTNVSEAILDHDYTLLAARRYGEGAREFWANMLKGVKRYDVAVVEPIRSFLNNDLRTFKDSRRTMESAQKTFDNVISRYLSQSKTKEASSLREDAFQVHETRKTYLRTSMDFCVQAPQLRASLDKLVVRIFAEQWKDMRSSKEATATIFAKSNGEMERVRGWSKEMENSERAFKRELMAARRQIEDSALQMTKPSRELDDYSASTVAYLGSGASQASGAGKETTEKTEKQGWLLLRTVTGKPARTVWPRRWFFVKDGMFGWLIQGTRSGGVEESEKTGVLLCSVRPAFQEERRFCFEVKTKDQSIILQAETQQELTEWISTFEMAKRKALEHPASVETSLHSPGIDPAFAITPPISPEFAAKVGDGHANQASEDGSTLDIPNQGPLSRASFDVTSSRRATGQDKDGEGTRDHAARIIQKLDLHKRSSASPQLSQGPPPGGIASLISASHNVLPLGPTLSQNTSTTDLVRRNFSLPASSLAPSSLANPPAATSLSHTAVVVGGEKGIIHADGSGMPSGLLANLWGSTNWGYVNRLGDDPKLQAPPLAAPNRQASISQDDSIVMDSMADHQSPAAPPMPEPLSTLTHRKTHSIGVEPTASYAQVIAKEIDDQYPSYYPLPLKAQNIQFRMLFPSVPASEKLVLVFRASWNPNEQQEFPGRVYVTQREIYFYSNHLGLVLITGVSLSSIIEVTSAPGRDCDYLYLHLKNVIKSDESRRVTVKIFLEPLRLLQRRLNYLIQSVNSGEIASLETTLRTLIRMESEEPKRSSSVESWEHVAYEADDGPDGNRSNSQRHRGRNVKASLRIDGNLYGESVRTGRDIQKFKLPAHPVIYAPQGMKDSITRDFNISAKALFHVIFGDKSAVFQLLSGNRRGAAIVQTPWRKSTAEHWSRDFTPRYDGAPVVDTQTIEIFNDHLCYVITNRKHPWQVPYADYFMATSKFVITHSAKSRCKLAIFQAINWHRKPRIGYLKRLVEQQAYSVLEADALDLTTVAMDQVAKLGSHSKTNKAIEIFGNIGQQTQASEIDVSQVGNIGGPLTAGRDRGPVSMTLLVMRDLTAKLLQLFGMLLDVFIALGKGVTSIITTHTILIALLLTSGLYNSWHSYRDGLEWYHDRNAAHFMARVGVKAEPKISKAIYLRDIEQMVVSTVQNDTIDALVSSTSGIRNCRTTFGEQFDWAGSSSLSMSTGRRLHRSRDALAHYRHDLLVALRVVNRIEKDVILSEWEEWVRSEEGRCARVEHMLQQQRKGQNARSNSSGDIASELGDEFLNYCKSCRRELADLSAGQTLI